jgi:hypothetical protein
MDLPGERLDAHAAGAGADRPAHGRGRAGYKNQFYLDFVEVRYQRTFAAASDTLTFDFPDGSQEFQVTG